MELFSGVGIDVSSCVNTKAIHGVAEASFGERDFFSETETRAYLGDIFAGIFTEGDFSFDRGLGEVSKGFVVFE